MAVNHAPACEPVCDRTKEGSVRSCHQCCQSPEPCSGERGGRAPADYFPRRALAPSFFCLQEVAYSIVQQLRSPHFFARTAKLARHLRECQGRRSTRNVPTYRELFGAHAARLRRRIVVVMVVNGRFCTAVFMKHTLLFESTNGNVTAVYRCSGTRRGARRPTPRLAAGLFPI